MLEYDRIDTDEGIDVNKNKIVNKECFCVVIGVLLIKALITKSICVMVVMICL